MMDYVFPYVDSEDPAWREEYGKVFGSMRMDESRFRSFGTLRYLLRSVAQNLPFIDRIVMIVSAESQVPDWIDRDRVRVVTHAEFMPEHHRPTFSSSAIESDMWRIDGLSEKFLYANDDLFQMKPMTEDDFFCGDKPRLTFNESDFHYQNIYRRSCRNGMDMIADALGVERTEQWTLLKPQHCTKGILTRHMKEAGRMCSSRIEPTITKLRHQTNVTGFIYHYYAYYTGEYEPFNAVSKFVVVEDDPASVVQAIQDGGEHILCINDSGLLSKDRYQDAGKAIRGEFEKLFPERCRYELF